MAHVDWISISIPLFVPLPPHSDWIGEDLPLSASDPHAMLLDWLNQQPDKASAAGRAPFTHSVHSKIGGWTIFSSPKLKYSLLEITGVGCEGLRRTEDLDHVLRMFGHRVTRIDIAHDIEGEDPIEWAQKRTGERFKSEGIMRSETGTTVYVGSRTSDRYCRVYRYNEPHPRAGLMRVEYVLKADNAKAVTGDLLSQGVFPVWRALCDVFGFSGLIPFVDDDPAARLTRFPRDVGAGGTERWLLTQVLPACEKLVDKGSADMVRYFIGQLKNLLASRGEDIE